MTNTQIKDYLKKYRIDSEEQLAKHIEELKRGTKPNNEIIFPLVDLLLNEKSVLNSFFAENKKQETIAPFFLDEAVISYQSLENGKFKDNTVTYTSTRHKSKAGETHKQIVGDLEDAINNRLKLSKKINKESIEKYKSLFTKVDKKCSPQCFCDGSCKEVGNPFERLLNNKQYNKPIFKDNPNLEENTAIPPYTEVSIPEFFRDWCKVLVGDVERPETFNIRQEETLGKKETEGKLNYELDWEFIEQMAERMSQNKGKYKPYNWKRPMEIEKLKQSLFRHVVEVMKGNYSDDGREFGHFESIALNSMMINYQLKVK